MPHLLVILILLAAGGAQASSLDDIPGLAGSGPALPGFLGSNYDSLVSFSASIGVTLEGSQSLPGSVSLPGNASCPPGFTASAAGAGCVSGGGANSGILAGSSLPGLLSAILFGGGTEGTGNGGTSSGATPGLDTTGYPLDALSEFDSTGGAPVPEPATFVLLGGALAVLGLRRARQRL